MIELFLKQKFLLKVLEHFFFGNGDIILHPKIKKKIGTKNSIKKPKKHFFVQKHSKM